MHKKGESEKIQRVIYFPAINALPKKLNTVSDMLLQSRVKGEHLGLAKTGVVVHQAIYAKVVEVLEKPARKDLKDFTVLRMGVFHNPMTFPGVI